MPRSLFSTIAPAMRAALSRRRTSMQLLAGLTAGLLLAVPVASARAVRHIDLASSSPAKGSHVMKPVTEIRLRFTGNIAVSTASVEMLAADSTRVPLGALAAVPDSATVAVAKVTEPLKTGNYTVKWKAIAEDGAEGSGSFTFMYMAPRR